MSWSAWAAGFIEGEGTITLGHSKKSGQVYLVVTASQNFREPLLKLQDLFGGTVVECPIRNRKTRHYLWRVVSKRAVEVLHKIRPWLMVKVAQADLGIEFQEKCVRAAGYNVPLTMEQRDLRLDYIRRIRALNHRGELIIREEGVA